ncbi:MAG: hypothetical protein Q9213_002785 [Squamulea squamosa]
MHFLKAAAFVLTASLALVDARAISQRDPQANGVIAKRDTGATPGDLKPRWTNRINGEKLSVRGLFGLGDDIKIAKSSFEANAKACSDALKKLRKARRKRAAYAKRAARAERKIRRKRADIDDPEDDEDDVMDGETDVEDDDEFDLEDDGEDGMDLGGTSHTVGQGQSDFWPFDNQDGDTIIGTVGLNSCSGVLIVGNNGAVIAHLDPISPNEGRTEDAFKGDVTDKVSKLYTDNRANLQNAKMYIAVPNGDNGEKAILEKAADDLGIAKDTTGYDRVADEVWDNEDYMTSGRGVMLVDFKDKNSPKVKVFGNNK